MIFNIAGAAAKMTVQGFGNRALEFCTRNRHFLQSFQQNLALVEKTRGAVTALEGEMLNKALLEHGELAIAGMALQSYEPFFR